jgi:hypothetical protein
MSNNKNNDSYAKLSTILSSQDESDHLTSEQKQIITTLLNRYVPENAVTEYKKYMDASETGEAAKFINGKNKLDTFVKAVLNPNLGDFCVDAICKAKVHKADAKTQTNDVNAKPVFFHEQGHNADEKDNNKQQKEMQDPIRGH